MEKRSRFHLARVLSLCAALVAQAGCGYMFQNSRNPLLETEGIRRIYIAPVENNTYKNGIENVVYNSLLRTFLAKEMVSVVDAPEKADAILRTVVHQSGAENAGGESLARGLQGSGPLDVRIGEYPIISNYRAWLGCSFTLERNSPTRDAVYSSSFTQNKTFLGNNRRGLEGTTSALINQSEFDRATRDLAEGMMYDLHEQMMARF